MSLVRRLIDRALLPERTPVPLAMIRFFFGAWMAWAYSGRVRTGFLRTCTQTSLDHFEPVGVVNWFGVEPLSEAMLTGWYDAMLVLSVLFAIGLWHRIIGPLYGVLVLFLLTYRNCWGFVYHTDNILAMQAVLVGLSPASDALSVDSWLIAHLERRKAAGHRGWGLDLLGTRGDPTVAHWKYGWPVQLIVLMITLTYSVAAIAKLGAQGLQWGTGHNLLGHIGLNGLWYEFIAGDAKPITGQIFEWPMWVMNVLAAGSLGLELFAPLVLLDRRLAVLFILAGLGLHWGIYMTMGIPFVYHLHGYVYVPFVPWDWLYDGWRRFQAWRARAPADDETAPS